MGPSLAHRIDALFAGARATAERGRVHATIPLDGLVYRARLETEPEAHVAVTVPCTDGFELVLRWNDRWANDGAPRASSFDDSFLVETNDVALATVWLDREAREALLASRYVSSRHADRRDTEVLTRDGTWVHEVSNDEVSARRSGGESSVERMTDILRASLLLASRPVRWARAFAATGRALGGEPASRVEVGGRPLLRVRRGDVDVKVRVVRRLGPGNPGRLRTIVGAHRHGSGGETLSLIREGLPRAAWPPAEPGYGIGIGARDAAGVASLVDRRAAQLLDAALPSATTVRRHDIEIAFDGAHVGRERLGAAIELAAYWAHPDRSRGPYR